MPKTTEPIELDGRTLEGGGQLLRIAVCLSALTGTPIKISNIRGNRAGGGGLKAQHLASVKWLAKACNAKIEGAEKGSKTLLFMPGEYIGTSPAFKKEGNYLVTEVDIGTAGSTGLALQAILPFVLFSRRWIQNGGQSLPVRLLFSGGTNVSGSPSYEYITQVLLPTLAAIGLPYIGSTLNKRGWSQGGSSIGSFEIEIPPNPLPPLLAFDLFPADTQAAPAQPSHLHATFLAPASCHKYLQPALNAAIQQSFPHSSLIEKENLTVTYEDTHNDKRLYLIIVATVPSTPSRSTSKSTNQTHSALPQSYILARDWLYDRKIRPSGTGGLVRATEEMAEHVVSDLHSEWKSAAWVDEYARDQLVILQALAKGRSRTFGGWEVNDDSEDDDETVEREPSLHARTAEWVARQMLGVKFNALEGCEGVGFGGTAEVGLADDLAKLKVR